MSAAISDMTQVASNSGCQDQRARSRGVTGGSEPADHAVRVLATAHQADPVAAVEFHRLAEHPGGDAQRRRDRFRRPGLGFEIAIRIGRGPVDEHRPNPSLATGNDIQPAAAVEVGEDRVFGRPDLSDRDRRPAFPYPPEPRMQISPNDVALFPPGGDVGQAVGVDIPQPDAIGTDRRIVDDMPPPREAWNGVVPLNRKR